jgi:hypothetical protein
MMVDCVHSFSPLLSNPQKENLYISMYKLPLSLPLSLPSSLSLSLCLSLSPFSCPLLLPIFSVSEFFLRLVRNSWKIESRWSG